MAHGRVRPGAAGRTEGFESKGGGMGECLRSPQQQPSPSTRVPWELPGCQGDLQPLYKSQLAVCIFVHEQTSLAYLLCKYK